MPIKIVFYLFNLFFVCDYCFLQENGYSVKAGDPNGGMV